MLRITTTDMGLGKTYIGSEKLISFGRCVNLVICQKSKIEDWIQHFENNYPGVVVRDLTNKAEFELFLSDTEELKKFSIGIINYELAWRRPELLKLVDFTLMLDESSLIQNATAKQTKFVLKLHPANVILLSGTPCSGKYENLWTQGKLLGWDISQKLYLDTYVNRHLMDVGNAKVWIVDKTKPYKHVDRLKRKLREHGAIFKRTDECFSLPEQIFTDITVNVTKEYREFMKTSITYVEDTEFVGDTTLTKILYARMLCGAHNKNKLSALKDLIQSTNDRLIIFYAFNADFDAIKQLCVKLDRPISVVNGRQRDLTAYEQEENSITLCQYQAGAKGLNLQLSNKIVYFDPTVKCEDYMQSQKRTHRIGQERTCMYYRLICRDSIEKAVYSALERGTDYTERLFEK